LDSTYHSWRNPVESVMAILKKEVAKCNSLTQLRKIDEETTSLLELNVTFFLSAFQRRAIETTCKMATTQEFSEFGLQL